jgi:hypothetical protein
MFAIIAIILFVLTMLFFGIIWRLSELQENFADTKYVVIDNNLNVDGRSNIVGVTNAIYTQIIDSIKVKNTIDKQILGIDSRQISLYIDPYIDYYIFDNTKNEADYKDGIFICLSHTKMNDDCIWNLEGKTVAYLFLSDYLFIQALIKGYRLDINNVKLKKITLNDLNSSYKTFDYCMTYAVIGSEYMQALDDCLYYKNGFKDVSIERLKTYHPFLIENYNNMRYYFNDNMKRAYVDGTENILIPMMKYKIVENVENIERFITRLNIPEDYVRGSKSYDFGYACYGNVNISDNKYECNSFYNVDGTPKTYYSLWDKQCKVNTDCPYYKANQNYPNERGGCNDDFCEFPVGIKRLGFIKHDATGLNSPMCYGCDDVSDLECCSKQENPDYVFDNDFNDRQKYDLNTIISLLDYSIQ